MADRKITALTELTAPVAADVFPIIDISESANANKNKKIQLTTVLKNIPNGTVSAPSVGFTGDSGLTGFFRVASNEIGISANQALIGSFTTTGFQLGSGTPAAQLHLFSTDTTDQVIIENSDTGADNAPDLVLFRNSASPAADDNLGNLVYRGEDSAGNTHDYASIVASIEDTSNGSEDGILDIMSSAAGTLASRIRLKNNKVGIGENDPIYPMHLTTTLTGQALQLQCDADDAASGANLMLYHRRGASGAGQDNDVISTIFYRGKNDAGTPEEVDFVGLEGVITDASDGTEDGKLNLQVMTAGTLTTKLAVDASGITVTGTVAATSYTGDGSSLTGLMAASGGTFSGNVSISDNAIEFDSDSSNSFKISIQGPSSLSGNTTFTLPEDGSANQFLKTDGSGALSFATALTAISADTTPTLGAGLSTNGFNIQFPDSTGANVNRAVFGGSADLSIYHDSNNSVIDSNTGNLYIQSANSLFIQGANNENVIKYVVNGALELYHDGTKKVDTTSSGITVTGTVTETSDIAYKSDIEPITNTLDKLQQITGYKYKLDNASIDSMGVIAQDVEKVFPELVHGNEGSKTLQYSGLIGVLVEAVKDLSAKVKKLESN